MFPVYFHMLGFSSLQFGMLYSIGPTVGIIANLVWGVTSDRFQTIKKIITTILSGQLVFILLMFRAEAYPVIFVLLTLYYFFQTPVNMLNDSQILLHTKQTGKSYASYRVWGSIGFAVAALLFGLLLKTPTHGKMALLCIGNVALALLLSLLLKDARGPASRRCSSPD
ncbi:MFS transporter [Paenibacillus sp. CC-CFT747]|nr:MFS transporter [Paenibacillus sp. CC-CFT747]